MKFKEVMAWIGAAVAILAVFWVLAANTLFMQKVFNPQFEQVRRDTFETSKAYRDGMAQELRALQIEYIKADPAIRPSLASAIKHKAAGVPDDALPYDLSVFIKGL